MTEFDWLFVWTVGLGLLAWIVKLLLIRGPPQRTSAMDTRHDELLAEVPIEWTDISEFLGDLPKQTKELKTRMLEELELSSRIEVRLAGNPRTAQIRRVP